jgi:glycosyltransferase involved in cell wall biosynthesis
MWIMDVRTGSIAGGIKGAFYDRVCALEAAMFDKTLVLSEGLKVKLFGPMIRNNIEIVPLGANLAMFKPAPKDERLRDEMGINRDDTVLVYTGRIDKTRKLEGMLEAFRIVRSALTTSRLRLLIIGGGPDRIEELKSQAGALGLAGDIILMRRIPYFVVPKYLASANIGLAYIPKNVAYDCQPPLKAFEYLAASLPVVATDTTANEEVIKDGLNGIIASDRPEDFAKGILRLIHDPPLLARIRENSVKSIQEFDWDKIVNRLMAIYQTE